MNRETLYDLRALLALYPYYQTARLLMLKNLYLLHDPSFDEELRRAAIYITDRKIIFEMVEAAHYQIKNAPEEAESDKQQVVRGIGAEKHGDRTSDLIDHFLGSIPMEEDEEEKKEKRKPTPANAAVDYVAYLMETEDQQEPEDTSRTMSLIDDFMEDGGFKLPKIQQDEDYNQNLLPNFRPIPARMAKRKTAVYSPKLSPASTSSRASIRGLTKSSAACISSILTRTDIMWTSSDSLRN